MKSLTILSSIAFAFLFTGFTVNHSDVNDTSVVQSKEFYYPASAIKQIMSQGNGLRLYNGYFPSMGGEALMAVAVTGEGDSKNVQYYLASGTTSGRDINAVDIGVAMEGCRNLESGNRFAITLRESDVNQLLSTPRATGISFSYANTSMGNRTLKVSPAVLEGTSVSSVSQDASFLVNNPCPIACGADVQSNYLCDMQ